VASGPAGLLIIDISRPNSQKVIGAFPAEDFANSVALSGDLAYISDGNAGIKKINIADPAAPKLEASFDTPGEPQGVAMSGSLVLIPDSNSLLILR
jgi:hypothetical protein